MSKKISVTGATGNIGQLVIPALIAGGAETTVLVRDADKARTLKEQGVKIVVGEFSDVNAVKETFAGADSILLIAPPNPDAAKQMSALISAAKESGNPYVVRMSAIGAADDAPTANGRLHHDSDEELKATGLPYTILRPHFFMQNIFMAVSTIKEQGNMYMGMGDGKMGMVDARDIADVSTKILLDGGHEGETYSPTGPESITFTEVASAIGKHLNKEVNYIQVTPEDVKKTIIDMGWGEWGGQVMHDYSKAYAEGWGDFTTDDVEKVTGKKSRSIEQFVNEVFVYGFQ